MATDHRAAACCARHLLRATKDVLGAETSKEVRLINVRGEKKKATRGAYFCYCGKPADFFITELRKTQSRQS